MTRTQKLVLPIIFAIMFACSAMYARHDYLAHINDEASQTLRDCGLNPVNGSSLVVSR